MSGHARLISGLASGRLRAVAASHNQPHLPLAPNHTLLTATPHNPHPHNMASKDRLERLRKRHQLDLDALPDRAPEPIFTDSDASGGVPLHAVDVLSKQTAADDVQPEPKATANTDRRYIWLQDAESPYKAAAATPPKIASSTRPPKSLPPLPNNDLNRGDLGSNSQHYTPIVALSKYPYKWCDRIHSQDIASAFFDQGQFWAREWDL